MGKRTLFGLAALAVSFALVPYDVPAASADPPGKGKKFTFMTRNLYLGADLADAVEAIATGEDPLVIASKVGQVWADVQHTDFATRAKALADEIRDEKPDLIGLQEAVVWRIGAYDPATPATTVAYDFVEILLDALGKKGHHYEVVAISEGFDAEFTGIVSYDPFTLGDIRLTDREVILARKGHGLKLSNVQEGHFVNVLPIPLPPSGYFLANRGWASVDCKTGNEKFRFVTTHLEADVPYFRELQAAELIAAGGPCDTTLPVVLVGDFNSDGDGGDSEAAYDIVMAAGFSDAWTQTHAYTADLYDSITWGHDDLLSDPFPFTNSPLERIDFVLYRGNITAQATDRLGEEPADRVKGLWPSDHAGIVSTLGIR